MLRGEEKRDLKLKGTRDQAKTQEMNEVLYWVLEPLEGVTKIKAELFLLFRLVYKYW